jgi:predicted  nucleic acid-binding Zn-ribbon protein
LGPAELLLRHWQLEARARGLSAGIARLTAQLERDPELERLLPELEAAHSARRELALRLREADREVEGHRGRLQGREKELMSGRVRNPTELMQMNTEVEHMRDRLRGEEDAELLLMEEVERQEAEVTRIEAEVAAARARIEADAPGLRVRIGEDQAALAEVEAERDSIWAQVPAAHQAAYRRIRIEPPVAEVLDGQCAACRVTVTSTQRQQLRRQDQVVNCENCGRLLVVA